MELGKLRSLIELLRESGITHYKDGDLELKLGTVPVANVPTGREEGRQELNEAERVLRGLDPAYGDLFDFKHRAGQ